MTRVERVFPTARLARRFVCCVAMLIASAHLGGCVLLEESVFRAGLAVERTRSGLRPAVLDMGNEQVAYLEKKGPGETIVLLHGFGSEKDTWLRFVRHLPRDYRVLVLDMPGHGESTRDFDRRYDVDSLASSVGGALERLAPEGVHLVGNSLGGMVALAYALEHEHRIASLGLINAAGVYPEFPSEFQSLLERGENPLIVTSRTDFDRLVDLVFIDSPPIPWPVRPVLVRRLQHRAAFNRKMWNDLWAHRRDLAGELARLDVPVFLLWGDSDRVLDVSSVHVFREYVPDVATVIMENCGHTPMAERPREAAGHYVEFLSTLAARGHTFAANDGLLTVQ